MILESGEARSGNAPYSIFMTRCDPKVMAVSTKAGIRAIGCVALDSRQKACGNDGRAHAGM